MCACPICLEPATLSAVGENSMRYGCSMCGLDIFVFPPKLVSEKPAARTSPDARDQRLDERRDRRVAAAMETLLSL